ncbi:hypothetical protein AHiyo8_34500 [Arthrobacter sp. Hiyo8]|nr:hypothetical protein AHiyo8_34500 [Arthrobacter sp. Hiyo8]
MVHADLLEFAIAQAVGAGIADVREVQPPAFEQQGGDRGAHARELRVYVDEFGEEGIGSLDFVREDCFRAVRVGIVIEVDHVQHGGCRGDVPPACPPMPSATTARCRPAYAESSFFERTRPTSDRAA